jgi:MFS family permease
MGYTGTKAQLYSVPPFAAAFVITMIFAFISDRFRARGAITAFSSVLAIIGFSMFYTAKHNNIRYASLFFSVPGAYLSAPTITTWVANNSAPATRRATAVAIAFILTNAGGITATWLLGSISPAPYYKSATRDFIIMSVLMLVFSIINTAYLAMENRKKKVIREQAAAEGKEKTLAEEPGLGDKSAWFVYST